MVFGINKCEMCGKSAIRIDEHHLIPWWFSYDDSESNIIRLCPSCHKKADAVFNNLILYGKLHVGKDTHKRSNSRYAKKYYRTKILFNLKLFKRTRYRDILVYNMRADSINIYQSWRYIPYSYQNTRLKSYGQLKRAAAVKSQATLTV